jgi:S1-C subfamily serine protease
MRAHVSILAERMEGGSWNLVASGSGVASAVGPGRLLILTCRHVVEPSTGPGTRIRLVWFGGSAQDAVVRWQSAPALDLALVECRPAPGTALPQVPPTAGLDRISVGQGVLAVGDPLNFRGSLVRGSLSALRSMGEGSAQVRVIQSQIPLNPGNSGGGLYTDEGMLIGINSWTIAKDRAEGMGFSVALDSLGARLDELPPDLAEDLRTWLQARAATDTSGAQQIGR